MSRTDLDATTIASGLRMRAGDGSIEWVYEPIQSSVLLDIADMLDENAKLREERERLFRANVEKNGEILRLLEENAKLRERAVSMLSELRGVVSEGDYDSPSGRYFLLRRDVAAYEDALRELGIEVD